MNIFTKEEVTIVNLVMSEYKRATSINGAFHSAHEGYAVILEELEELKAEVFKKAKDRSFEKMTHEASQVAAMGIRFIIDICLENNRI